MSSNQFGNFSFDEWAALFLRDPEAFEVERKKTLAAFIETSEPGQRKSGHVLQREIDWVVERAKSSDELLNTLRDMLFNQFIFLSEASLHMRREMSTIDKLSQCIEQE